jgi:elongation factor 4
LWTLLTDMRLSSVEACNFMIRWFSSTVREASTAGAHRERLRPLLEFACQPELNRDSIRNFCVLAHIDHGKSTLSDRLLEKTGNIRTLERGKEIDAQVLDTLRVEQERGITVKAQTASMLHHVDGQPFLLNLIDTPGHSDFIHETFRSVSASEGAILAVDASQAIEAQTIATYRAASKAGLDIIPVLTKCDLPLANPERVREQLFHTFGMDPDSAIEVSAKTGSGIEDLLRAVVERVRAPAHPLGVAEGEPRAILVDSTFDTHVGAICIIKVVSGEIQTGDRLGFYYSKRAYDIQQVGLITPQLEPTGMYSTAAMMVKICLYLAL